MPGPEVRGKEQRPDGRPGFYPEAQLILSAEGVFGGQKKTTVAPGSHTVLPAFAEDHTKALLGVPRKIRDEQI